MRARTATAVEAATSYYPGWRVKVDGKAVSTTVAPVRGTITFGLQPGEHRVVLSLEPTAVRRFADWLSAMTLALVALAVFTSRRKPREEAGLDAQGDSRAVRSANLERALCLGGVLLIAVLAGRPLFQAKLLSGHDALAYLPRHVEFYENLAAGQLIPRWAPDLASGYGEPTFNFNPPVIYYVPALFHAAGMGFAAPENMGCFVLLLLSGLGMYLLAGEFFGPGAA